MLFSYLYVTQVLRTRAGINSHNISGTPGNKAVATRLYKHDRDVLLMQELCSGVARIWCQEGPMQKLLGFYRRQLSTSRCQTLYRSKCTEKK